MTRQVQAGRGHAGKSRPGMPGIRWIPIPIAILATTIGWLVFGSLQGQSAATLASQNGYQAGGLQLTVQQMVWMSNDMTGQGPIKLPKGFPMDPTMMSGMQPANDDRLHVTVHLRNLTSSVQTFKLSDFRLVAPGGQSWPIADDGGNASMTPPDLQPNYGVDLDVYFDVPIKQNKNLSVEWSRSGTRVDFPVNTSGAPTEHHH